MCIRDRGEQSALEYFRKYPGRFELWHIKDLSDDLRDATLGEGNVDFVSVFNEKKLSGMKYFFVEQDSSRKRSPMENIRISHDFLLSKVL
jgi:sugar phosphate isomerase/epimerase